MHKSTPVRTKQASKASKAAKTTKKNLTTKKTLKTTTKRKMSVSKTASFKVNRPFKVHKLDSMPSETVETNAEEMIKFYSEMALYRRVEIVADTLYKQRLIRGFCHLYDGQEAVIVGMEHNLKKPDSIITAYRDHCHQISRGDSIESMFAELMGRRDGCSLGKGGSMHMYYKENNFYGGNGIVGAQVPLGAGIAFAHKYNKDGGLCVAAYGDGAANQGQVFEAANMAAMWKLPLIFLCENNDYAMGTATARHAASTTFYTRGDYVPGLWIDGMDVLAVKEGFRFATDYIRKGNGPLFVEVSCYRYHGHSMSDPGLSYRTRDEVSNVRASRDPIDNARNRIFEAGFATPAEIKQIDKDIKERVDIAAEKAKASPQPPVHELYENIFHGAPPKIVRDVEMSTSVSPKH
jgi:pyruvate dehydrogenase E1 component alpha subunit